METSLVGSYPQPEWLVDREKLRGRLPPRVRASDIWKIDPDQLADAQDAATLAAIRDQERAGLDIVTDGEIRRESYSNYFVLALDGIDVDKPGRGAGPQRPSHARPARGRARSRRRGGSILRRDAEFLRGAPTADQGHGAGPVHDGPQAQNDLYGSDGRSRSRSPTSCARRCSSCSRPAWTSSSSTSRGWSRAPSRPASTGSRRSAGAGRRHRHHRPAHLLRLPAVRPRPPARVPLPGRARAAPVDQISIETAQAELDLRCWPSSTTRRSCSA